jgi:alkylhydroperoxidase family enzyme
VAALQGKGAAEFTPAERAAIAFAEGMTRGGVSEATFAELRTHFDERAIVEIAAVTAVFNYTNRFNTALDMDLTVYPKPLA